jgi:hypothetical protein
MKKPSSVKPSVKKTMKPMKPMKKTSSGK